MGDNSPERGKMARLAAHPPYHLRFEFRSIVYLMTTEFVSPAWSALQPLDPASAGAVLGAAARQDGFDRLLRNAFPAELGHLPIPYAAAPACVEMLARRRVQMFALGKPSAPPPKKLDDLRIVEDPPADRTMYDKLVKIIAGVPDVPRSEFQGAALAEFEALVKALVMGGVLKMAAKLAAVIASWVALHFVPGAGVAALVVDAGMVSLLVYSLGFAALQLIDDLSVFVRSVHRARTDADLKPLSVVFAGLAVKIGITLLLTALTRSIAKRRSGGGKVVEDTGPLSEPKKLPPIPGKTSAPENPEMPKGIEFKGTVHRLSDADRASTSYDIHPGNVAANHRYSGVGKGAVYGATSKKTAVAEMGHYTKDISHKVEVPKDVHLKNVLDMTNPKVRDQIGVKLEDINGASYKTTQKIGAMAEAKGYDGILAPSARNPEGSNLIIFAKGLK